MTISTEISTAKKAWTDAEFMVLSEAGQRYELVDGELVDIDNSGMEHGGIGSWQASGVFRQRYAPCLGNSSR